MKKAAITFVLLVLATLLVLPAANLCSRGFERHWWQKSSLYSFDAMLPALSRALYSYGMSIRPDQAMVGKDGWLLLGDVYANTVSSRRDGVRKDDNHRIRQIRHAVSQWRDWALANDVKALKFMIAPDKETVYPEFLPDWAKPAAHSFLDALVAGADPQIFFDGRASQQTVRSIYHRPVYYRCDSHWNAVGTLSFFHHFMQTLQREPAGAELTFLKLEQFRVEESDYDRASDLAAMLNLQGVECDKEVNMHLDIGRPIEIERYGFYDGRLLGSGGNPLLIAPATPELIRSRNALNDKKVLWLRDSFGDTMSPLMAATFTEVLHLHHRGMTRETLVRLVSSFRPDYVFIMTVERDAIERRFTVMPPA